LEVTGLQTEIRRRVEERVSTRQREFFLKEQLKEIQKELGLAKDDKTLELERLRQRLAALTLPAAARQRIDEEMNKLAFLEVGSPEYAVTRNYLDALTALPWGKLSADNFDLAHARAVLDREHDGLDDLKERIIEFLAVGAQSGRIAGSIMLLVGPPGTGKSSVGRSIATALGRAFYRFSVGGMRDEAEIKGHRRTYVGAMPGKILQALREAGTANPVIMLDEIDKIGAAYHGDPAAALLEVLDPEQNADFLDHYLDLRFDLSKVLFICTANQLDTIPRPLLDRMEVIRLAGYISAEKQRIAKRHLWPKQRTKAGLKAAQIVLSDTALRRVIEDYAREAGVRKLEMQLGAIARKAVVRMLDGAPLPIRIAPPDIPGLLGPTPFRPRAIARGVGLANGLAWTPLGGATLDIEASVIHRKGRAIKVTGQLGGVMRESAEIALSYVEANLGRLHASQDFFEQATIHLHVPEGATPKDGPSAGITIASAFLSLALNQPIARPLAMTGELTLTGQVLPVGGIKEKVVAARRVGLRELILPAANEADYNELPDYLRNGLRTRFVARFEEVAELCFREGGKSARRAPGRARKSTAARRTTASKGR
jgi:ATP-dependent Lon protease